MNYGHSFGHAIGKLTNHRIPHGLAVAHGMNIANFFSATKINEIRWIHTYRKNFERNCWQKQISNMRVAKFVKILKQDKKLEK